MDEIKAQELFDFFNQEGYDLGDFNNFTSALTDDVKRENLYSFFNEEGYDIGSLENFTLKKKDESVSTVQEEVTESITPTEQEEPVLLESSTQEVEEPVAIDFTPEIIEESVPTDFTPAIDFADKGSWKPKTLSNQESTITTPEIIEESVPTDFTPNVVDFSKGTEDVAGEKDTLLERTFGKNEITDLFGDLYRAGAAGQAQGGSVDEALELFAKGSDASQEDIDDFIAAQKRMQSMGESDEMRDFQKIYQADGGGWLGFIKGVIANPTVIPQLFVSSVSAMATPATLAGAAGGAAAGAAIAGPAGALIGAMGMAGTTLETGLTYAELLQEELGGKEMTEENIREILGNQEKMNNIRFKAVGRGLTIGAIDAISGGIATKVVGKVAGMTGRKLLAGAAGGAVEAVGGSLGEVGGRLVAGQEMDIAEIGFEGIAGTATAPLTVGYGLYKAPKYSINGKDKDARVTGPDMAKFIREASPQDLIKAEVNIVNDNELQSIYDEKYKEAIVSEDILKVNPDMNKPTLDAITKLQVELDNLKSNETQPAKDRAKAIKEEIKNLQENPLTEKTEVIEITDEQVLEEITKRQKARGQVGNSTTQEEIDAVKQELKEQANAIQEPSTETVDVQEQTGDSQTVGEGDTEVSELTTETTQEVQEPDVSPEVQAEGNIIGGAYTSYDNTSGEYTFDVVVDERFDGKGVGSKLLNEVIEIPFEIQDMNPDAKVVVDVDRCN